MNSKLCPICNHASVKCTEMYEDALKNAKENPELNYHEDKRLWGPPTQKSMPVHFKSGLQIGLSIGFFSGLIFKSLLIGILCFTIATIIFGFSDLISRIFNGESLNYRKEYNAKYDEWLKTYFCNSCASFYFKNGDKYEINNIASNSRYQWPNEQILEP